MFNINQEDIVNCFINEYIVKINQYNRLGIEVTKKNVVYSIFHNHKCLKILDLKYRWRYNIASFLNFVFIFFKRKTTSLPKKIFIFTDIRQDSDVYKVRVGLYNFRNLKYLHFYETLIQKDFVNTFFYAKKNYSLFKKNIEHYTKKNNINYNIFKKLLNISFIRYFDICLTLKATYKNRSSLFYFASHFDVYTSLLSLCREKSIIKYLEGAQHGLYELSSIYLSYNKLYIDQYNLRFKESEYFVLNYFMKNFNTKIVLLNNKHSNINKLYKKVNKKLIAYAMQNDNFQEDEIILDILTKKYNKDQHIIIVYFHPLTKIDIYKIFKSKYRNIIFERINRYSNVDILYTRYSTIGLEYYNMGVEVFYILRKTEICIMFNKYKDNKIHFLKEYNEI